MDYADLQVHIFAEQDVVECFGKESQIITSSHRGNLDWISGFVLGVRYQFLHVSQRILEVGGAWVYWELNFVDWSAQI